MGLIKQLPFDMRGRKTPKLTFCERFDEKSDIWNIRPHNHNFIELLYFLDGKASIAGMYGQLDIYVYDVVIYPAGVTHKESIDFSLHNEIICLGITVDQPVYLDQMKRISDIDGNLRWIFQEIHTLAQHTYPWKDHMIDQLLCLLLHYLNIAITEEKIDTDPIHRAIQFMHKNISNHITTQDLATVANYSYSYLDRQFKARSGLSPMKYFERLRLTTGKQLLARKDLSISQVATLIGYDDPKYFSRRFTSLFQMPPRTYRKELTKLTQ